MIRDLVVVSMVSKYCECKSIKHHNSLGDVLGREDTLPNDVTSDTLFIFVFGEYSNASKTKTYFLNTIFTLSISSNKPIYRKLEQENEVRTFLYVTKPFVRNFFERNGFKY